MDVLFRNDALIYTRLKHCGTYVLIKTTLHIFCRFLLQYRYIDHGIILR